MNDASIKRYALMVLFQAQQDHATELLVRRSDESGAPIRYQLGGTWHDWKSPGTALAPAILDEISTLAGFGTRPFPREGLIDVNHSGLRLLWIARMASSDACTLTPIEP